MENQCRAAPSPRTSGASNGRKTLRHTRDPSHERAYNGEPRTKRPKRGNYVPKACTQCQRRKTKCEGGYPCNACTAKGLPCAVRNIESRRQQHSPEISGEQSENVATVLNKIQRQLNEIIGRDQRITNTTPRTPAPGEPITSCRRKLRGQSGFTEVFSGEPSIVHVLHEMEGHLERLGMGHTPMASPPSSPPLTPVQNWSHDGRSQNKILEILHSHSITIDKCEWDQLLHTFFEEIYVLYPFLHPPTLRRTYEDLSDTNTSCESTNDRAKFAQVLFCLATGRCSESTRTDTGEGRHSAGWSLFQAGMDVLGEPLEVLDAYSAALEALQAILLAVIYLFRIDANNKAEKLLALVVSHSHSMGLHRKRPTDEMSIFEAEILRRVWWCTYIIDRRLALDTGRPFLIQDVNTDVPVPLEVSEEWLSQYIGTTQTAKQLKEEIRLEIDRKSTTPIPHLAAMVDFSRVVGKVWEAHFGALDMNPSSTPLTTEYLEFLVSSTVQKDPSRVWSGSREPFHMQFAGMEWWQIKQKMLMRIRWLFLRLLIRKSTLHMPCLLEVDESANAMICIQLSRSIILEFNHIPEKYPKHTFPFINYVATAAIIALGLIINQPRLRSTDTAFVSLAAEILKRFCTQTWVSGRIIRAVARIDQVSKLAVGNMGVEEHSLDHLNQNSNDASQYISNDFHRRTNDPSVPLNHSESLTYKILAEQEFQSNDTQQAPSHMTLGMNVPISTDWVSNNLSMTDFDFEEGLRCHNEPNGGWPWLSDFWDTGVSMHYQNPGEYTERWLPPSALFSGLGSISLDTVDPEALEFGRVDASTANPSLGDESRILQSDFETGL